MQRIRQTRGDRAFDAINVVLMTIVLLIMLYPLYFIVIASFSEPYDVAKGHVVLIPSGFTLEAYQNVFKSKQIWVGYRNTAFYTLAGTALSLCMTIPAAYVLSKKQLPGRVFFTWYCLITMYFSGGMIPTYLIVKQLQLINRPFTLVVLGSASIYNLIVTRVYFATSIPEELFESARIDGAREFRCFFQIALPLAMPIVAVMALFFGVTRWNDFFNALIYTSDSMYQPLQLVLRSILLLNQTMLEAIATGGGDVDSTMIEAAARQAYMAETMKYALIFIASAPLLAVYPFVQKYFVQGIMIGSLKG